MKRIAITTGDEDGIGFEITAKALKSIGPSSNTQFVLFRSTKSESQYLPLIESRFKRHEVSRLSDLSKVPRDSGTLIDVVQKNSPALWVESVAQLCMKGELDGLVTAPLSKTKIKAARMNDVGHTQILQRISKAKHVFMGFAGEHMRVVLATDHIALRAVSDKLSSARLTAAIQAAEAFRTLSQDTPSELPIGIMGLNPHAGEGGLIGREEKQIVKTIQTLKRKGLSLEGPLVPDVAFQKDELNKYAVFVALYHDQGLIPFKMLHGHSGVHISLGLPFTRTSVDHGTAKNIFGLNKADPQSMIEAIRVCLWAQKEGEL